METVIFLGKRRTIKYVVNPDVKKANVREEQDFLIVTFYDISALDLQKTLIKFYKQSAKKHFENRLRYFQPMFKKKFKTFTVEANDARWGSCNSNGELTFHWKLMMYPEEAIDYVIIHELCHLEHMNHDRSFWRLVGKHCPNYKELMPILGTEKTRDL